MQSTKKFVFRSSYHRVFHVQKTVVGIQLPMRMKPVGGLCLNTPIFDLTCVDILGFAIYKCGRNQILAIYVKEIQAIRKALLTQPLRIREFVIDQSLRLQIRILGWKHIHLPNRRVPETLADHGL